MSSNDMAPPPEAAYAHPMIPDEPVRGSIPPPWFAALPGIERIRALERRRVPWPPLFRLLGIRVAHVGAGSATLTVPASAWNLSAVGMLEVSPFYETALLAAATTALLPGQCLTPLSMTAHGFRPPRPMAGRIVARARVLNLSGLYIATEADIEDSEGRHLARVVGHGAITAVDAPAPPAVLEAVQDAPYATPDPYQRPVVGNTSALSLDEHTTSRIEAWVSRRMRAPVDELYGRRVLRAEEGRVVITVPATEWTCQFSRRVAPGLLVHLGNAAAWGATMSMMQPGDTFVNITHLFSFHREIIPDGRLLEVEAVLGVRDPLMTCDVIVRDADGVVVATGTGNGTVVPSARRQRRPPRESRRVLATLLFTDVVESTRHARQLGDARWSSLLGEYHTAVRCSLAAADGVEVKTTGDGMLARFDSPSSAVACARTIRDAARSLDLEIRAGVHAGECELQGAELAGVALHIAARIQTAARPGAILVSETVRHLVAGSGLSLEDAGEHELRGVPGRWRLYALSDTTSATNDPP